MRTTVVLVLLVPFVLSSTRAHAQAEPACETVTTVRCSGSAAALAVPGHAPPAAAAAPVAPSQYPPPPVLPPVLPPQADDAEVPRLPSPGCCAPAPQAAVVYPGVTGVGGWRLSIDETGHPVLERKVRTPRAGLWVTGLVLWLGSYVGTSIGGVRDDRPWTATPFFGGFISSGIAAFDGDATRGFGYALGSMIQIGGFVAFIAGLAGNAKLERMPVQIAPLSYRDGGGIAVGGRF